MEKLNSFSSIFAKLEDSVIKKIQYDLDINKICMLIEAKDNNGEWRILNMTFNKIKELKFEEIRSSNSVIYDSVFTLINDTNDYLFDFSPYTTEYDSSNDYKKSTFYMICKDFEFNFK